MHLLVISHTPHYRRNGEIVGWGATIREIDELASLFDSVTHLAPLYPEAAPASAMAYRSGRVRLRPVRPAGGERLRDKCSILLHYPGYARAILAESRSADVVHIRAPANLSLLALLLTGHGRGQKLSWIKYAGDWRHRDGVPWSYRFQRWWLRNSTRSLVTVSGRLPNQASHIRSFWNPCLTASELAEGLVASQHKSLRQPLCLLFVGRIEAAKGVAICLEVMAELEKSGISAHLDLVGEGVEQRRFEQQACELRVASHLTFHGGLTREALGRFYSKAHFILLPSESEGWPKVLSEAMAYGVVPIASAAGSIPEYLEDFSTGVAIHPREAPRFTAAIKTYLQDYPRWQTHSRNAVDAAPHFSYETYLRSVRELLRMPAPLQPGVA